MPQSYKPQRRTAKRKSPTSKRKPRVYSLKKQLKQISEKSVKKMAKSMSKDIFEYLKEKDKGN